MRNLLWVFMGAVLGFAGGWHLRDLGRAPVRPSEALSFLDRFADEQVHYLSAAGTWRGADIANKINLVRILCDATTKLCEMRLGARAALVALRGRLSWQPLG